MRCYHGCSVENAARLLQALETCSVNKLYVTETQALAARYANAQATRVVSAEFASPVENTVIFAFEAAFEFFRRPVEHESLDLVEAVIDPRAARLISIAYRIDDYTMSAFRDPKCAWWLDEPQSRATAAAIVIRNSQQCCG